MPEILVFSNEDIQSHEHLIDTTPNKFLNSLTPIWMEREEAETNEDYRQPIIYSMLEFEDDGFLLYQRAGGGEKRLNGLLSVGIGGHVDKGDADKATTVLDILENSFIREYQEEVDDPTPFNNSSFKYESIFRGNATPVDRVHMAIFANYYTPSSFWDVTFNEGSVIGSVELGVLLRLSLQRPDIFETWTNQFLSMY